MKKQINLFIVLIVVLSVVSCGNKQGQQQQKQGGPAPAVTVRIPSDSAVTFNTYPASVEGVINSEARAKISGYITNVLVDEGNKVKEGQVLFTLETKSLSEEAAGAKANINVAQVRVDQLKPLVEKDIVSKNQLETARAQLLQAQSSYESTQANISYGTVRSPVDGYVGEIRIRKGNLVSPSDPKPLTTVAKIERVYAYFSMNEKDYLNFLKTAKGETKEERIENMPPVTMILANGDEYEHKGKIETINSQVGKGTGSISFRAVFDNPGQILNNGSSGKIKVPKFYKDALQVPQKSTFEEQGATYVMKVQKNDTANVVSRQSINILDKTGTIFIVNSGVEEGDMIIAEGLDNFQTGMAVDPKEQPFDSIVKPVKTIFR